MQELRPKEEKQMAMYETIFILDSLLSTEEIDKIINRVKELVETNAGKMVSIDKWGKRRLAYEIQKKQYGFYVAIEFEGEGPLPNALANEYNFNDKILRYLTYRYTKNKLKAREKERELKKDQPESIEIEKPVPVTASVEKTGKVKEKTELNEEVDNG
jgi:small subunit ribosomal protein S6